jgi:hypothetical protein
MYGAWDIDVVIPLFLIGEFVCRESEPGGTGLVIAHRLPRCSKGSSTRSSLRSRHICPALSHQPYTLPARDPSLLLRDFHSRSQLSYHLSLLKAVYRKRPSLCPSKTSRPSVSCLPPGSCFTPALSWRESIHATSFLCSCCLLWFGEQRRSIAWRGNSGHELRLTRASADPFAEADEDTGETKQSQQNYIHIRIQRTSSLPAAVSPASLAVPPPCHRICANVAQQSAMVVRP